MSNETREEMTETHTYGKETVGALLHRERVTRRISVQRVAEDLKFNEDYLVAIEESRYNDLPAIPYVRVYIRTIAQYLSLDGEALLERFANEIQVEFPDPEKERHDTMRISIQDEKKSRNWIGPLVGVLIAAVLAFFFIRSQSNKVEEGENQIVPTVDSVKTDDTTKVDTVNSSPVTVKTPIETPVEVDTVKKIIEETTTVTETPAETTTPEVSTPKENAASAFPLDSLVLDIAVTKDSSFVQVITGKRKVFNGLIKKGEKKIFRSETPIFVKVGRNSILQYHLNGAPVSVSGDWKAYSKFSKEKGFEKSSEVQWAAAR